MFFTQDFTGPSRLQQFSFFSKGSAIGSFISEVVQLGERWYLQEVRLHFSTAMGSVKYIVAKISANVAAFSSFNTLIQSDSLNGLQDYRLYWSAPLFFASCQDLVIEASVLSVANEYGLQVIGWAVID
jgi:hypothetical protein